MSHFQQTPQIFNHPQRFIEGWYWLLRSSELRRGQVKAVSLLGRDLAVYRTESGEVVALDAYCPHMGAHLAEGRVQGETLRCFFHNWQFGADGQCLEVPCLGRRLAVAVKSWIVQEAYGLIWLWTGQTVTCPLSFAPELEHEAVDYGLGRRFIKECHPNVVMVNAIDAHHFNTVHNFPLDIVFRSERIHKNGILFRNTTRGGRNSWLVRLIQPFYQEAGTYDLCYWFGSTGTVTLGPDFLHFYILFALRLREDGQTEGETVLLTKHRPGWWGWLLNRLILLITNGVGLYFAKGDTQIFKTIKFNLKTPIAADKSIGEFIEYVESQKALVWGSWEPVEPVEPVEPEFASVSAPSLAVFAQESGL
ncbi:MAG: Rieske 2Fe-2S domain-containing protein [Microcystaceae cyanobacterium]